MSAQLHAPVRQHAWESQGTPPGLDEFVLQGEGITLILDGRADIKHATTCRGWLP